MITRTSFLRGALLALALAGAPAPALAGATGLPAGHCINVAGHFETGRESGWGGKLLDEGDLRNIRAAGFDTIRLPVKWLGHSSPRRPYTIDPKWMARISEVVDQALANGLNVILNSHYFTPVEKNPARAAPRLAALWGQIARHFADRPAAHLWFEIENEPHGKLTNANLMATLGPSLAAIRSISPDRPVIIGGDHWSSVDSLATLDLPGDPNVYPTFHYYEPFEFTHQGASWIDPVPALGRVYGLAKDKARLAADVAKVKAYIARTGRIPFMGETGAYVTAPLEQRIAYHRAVYDAFTPLGVSQCEWAYTNTFPFYDYKKREWLPGMLEAIGLRRPVPQ